jgi:hypothetical protein
MSPSEIRKPILASLDPLLRPLGFSKVASVFSRPSQDVVHLIEVQGSQRSVAAAARFTVNVGVYVPALVPADVRAFRKPSIPAAHWRERVGFLGGEHQDQWWEVHGPAGAAEAASEITSKVRLHALPVLAGLQNLSSLIKLWQTGFSPGLPPKLRLQFLSALGATTSQVGDA